jgi:hypothetical protein
MLGRPIKIPRVLGIAWWWLIVACAAEGGVRYYFHWHRFESVNIMEIWLFAQALWLKRAMPQSRAIYWLAAGTLLSFGLNLAERMTGIPNWLDGTIGLASFVMEVTGIFACMWAMERYFNETEPVGLKLSGLMTFFFNVLYFQYHFHDIYRDKHADQLSIRPFEA